MDIYAQNIDETLYVDYYLMINNSCNFDNTNSESDSDSNNNFYDSDPIFCYKNIDTNCECCKNDLIDTDYEKSYDSFSSFGSDDSDWDTDSILSNTDFDDLNENFDLQEPINYRHFANLYENCEITIQEYFKIPNIPVELIVSAIKEDYTLISLLKGDQEYDEIVKKYPDSIKYIDIDKWTTNIIEHSLNIKPELISYIIEKEHQIIIPDFNIMTAIEYAVQVDGLVLSLVKSYLQDEFIVAAAIENNIEAYKYASLFSASIANIMVNKIGIPRVINIINDKDFDHLYYDMFCLEIVKINGKEIKNLNTNNKSVLFAALNQNPFCIKYISSFNQTYEIIKKCSELSTVAIKYISPRDINDLHRLISYNPQYIKYIDHKYFCPELFSRALSNDISTILFIRNVTDILQLVNDCYLNINELLSDQYFIIVEDLVKKDIKLLDRIKKESYDNLSREIIDRFYKNVLTEKNFYYTKYLNTKYIPNDTAIQILGIYPKYIKYFSNTQEFVDVSIISNLEAISYADKKYINSHNIKASLQKYLPNSIVIENKDYVVSVKNYLYPNEITVYREIGINEVIVDIYKIVFDKYNLTLVPDEILSEIYNNYKENKNTTIKGNLGTVCIIKKDKCYIINEISNNSKIKLYKINLKMFNIY